MADAKLVTAGKPGVSGSVYRAAVDTTLPTDAVTALNAAFVSLGYVSEDGLTNGNSIDSTDIKEWGGETVLSIQTSKTETFQFTLISALDVNVLKAIYGDDNVTGTIDSALTVNVNAKEQEYKSWVFEIILNSDYLKRIVVPAAKITSVGDVVYKNNEAVGYEVTLTCRQDKNGNTHYEYIQAEA